MPKRAPAMTGSSARPAPAPSGSRRSTPRQAQWTARAQRAGEQIESLSRRAEETRATIVELAALPQQLADRRLKLMNTLAEAEQERKAASDALPRPRTRCAPPTRTCAPPRNGSRRRARSMPASAPASRPAQQRLEACERRIAETLQCAPAEVLAHAGLDPEQHRAPPRRSRRKLLGLREDRERLGGVNLRADEEAVEVAKQLEGLIRERDDLVQAINKLRGGISSLNREGRQRLLDAFETVNEKFAELFTTLFGGGKAELQLIESDDPLEAGLEIIANPPGKKPTTLSLLSGGEQTLTALSLIFAVFLTNPSPICVLDEVDAPLDDHNVERFCNLLDAMLERTETRFLIITHHALTMARMHRLFGVTMMERGVSQLVSVNLQQAETLAIAS